ncbi:hypothetical protein [Nocardiopsis sp. MG754419]|uniref:hypothetical protein n=1 Tax=Nocardiopsis sp. MG754419 TaxID=2259865 RepID=UPI001BA9773A|nr:hypothetical protein [Nocardiopsis sp. MG754419]MBR8744239.1 hypothetical protein [Nocardiopsis sp. MG754419]
MRHTTRIALLPLALLLPLTACDSPRLQLESSERLNDLLPSSSDYPDGLRVESIDVDELNGESTSGTDFDSVSPAACDEALASGPGEFPTEAVQGAGQVAVADSSDALAVYSYVLVSGDFDADVDDTAYETMLDSCSSMTVVNEGIQFKGGLERAESSALPEDDQKFTMNLSAEGMDMVMWTAWGQVEDVYFVLIGMDLGTGSSSNTPALAAECYENGVDQECLDRIQEEADAEATAAKEERFEEILDTAMESLVDHV